MSWSQRKDKTEYGFMTLEALQKLRLAGKLKCVYCGADATQFTMDGADSAPVCGEYPKCYSWTDRGTGALAPSDSPIQDGHVVPPKEAQ